MSIFDFFRKGALRREKYREEYRQMSENERDDHRNLMEHYSVFGGPFQNKALIEMCEAAQEVEKEEDS
jgi:hypothetical protein